jgi:uncharacterized protein (DUF849 family)
MATWPPFLLAVAPTGARRSQRDHPALPLTSEEIARTALACVQAGAAMLHLHVRGADGAHSLDVGLYREATSELRRAVGDRLLVQVTSEAVGRYRPEEQMALVRALRPEAVSLALREVVPDAAGEGAARTFFAELREAAILPQLILFSPDELAWLDQLMARGVVPGGAQALLFVIGRYGSGRLSEPRDLVPFLAANEAGHGWMVCAFGPRETAVAVAAAALGGHARIGFENNLHLPDGRVAPDNAALVSAVAAGVAAIGRPLATADEGRSILAAKDVA